MYTRLKGKHILEISQRLEDIYALAEGLGFSVVWVKEKEKLLRLRRDYIQIDIFYTTMNVCVFEPTEEDNLGMSSGYIQHWHKVKDENELEEVLCSGKFT